MDSVIQQVTNNFKRHGILRRAGRRAERYLLTFRETLLDIRYNINTRWEDIRPSFPDDEGYGPISYAGIKYIQQRVGFAPNEVFVDIGCGRGRAICMFARQRAVARCVGVEYHATHAQIALRNARNVRRRVAPILVIQGDAAEQDYTDITLFLLVNPFGEATMRRTIQRIALSLQANPRPIRLVYVNPKYENVLAEQPWLAKTDNFFIPNRIRETLPTSVWSSPRYEVT